MNIKNFIFHHNIIKKYKCYCEIIITPEGDIHYANPSHIYKLIALTGESENEINNKMPTSASPIHWLVEYTECCAVWYDYLIMPFNYTETQVSVIKELMKNNILASHLIGRVTQEKTKCELLSILSKTGDESILDQIQENQEIELWR